MGTFSFHFKLFPKGLPSRNTKRKHMGLYFVMEAAVLNKPTVPTGAFISSELVIVNQVDYSCSQHHLLNHRFAHVRKLFVIEDFLHLGSVRGPQSEFLLNGTDLQINVDVRMVDEIWNFANLPMDASAGIASTRTENDDRAYEGTYIWNINNYNLFAERLKNRCALNSPLFQMGESLYYISLEVDRENTKQYLFMSLHLGEEIVDEDQDKYAFCLNDLRIWNKQKLKFDVLGSSYGRLVYDKQDLKYDVLTNTYGSTGFDMGGGMKYCYRRLKLMEISKFEDSSYISDGKLQLALFFCVLKEKGSINIDFEDRKTIWNLRAQPHLASTCSSKSNKDNAIEYITYRWNILNLFKMVSVIEKYRRLEAIKIMSRYIKFGDYETRCTFFPPGIPEQQDHLVMGFQSLNSSVHYEMDLLVHWRLGIVNQIDSGKSIFREEVVLFNRQFNRSFPFISLAAFHSESGGYIVDEKVELVFDIRQVQEKLREEELPVWVSIDCKLITWEVDNFLLCQGIASEEQTDICSKYFEVQGCRIKLAIAVSGISLTASLHPDPALELGSNYLIIRYRIALSKKHRSRRSLQWVDGLRNESNRNPVALGLLNEFKWDKLVFYCEINECVKVVLNDDMKPSVMQATSSRSVDRY